MKALLVSRPRSFVSVEVPKPSLPVGEKDRIVVKTAWVSMCGSDIPKFAGSKRHLQYPLLPGAPIHECVGVVVESTSEEFTSGDWVVALPDNDQGLAEYFAALAVNAVRLPASLEECDACCLIQPLSTVMSALDRIGSVAGRSFVVVGLGSIGLLFCWLLQKRGATTIIGIDPVGFRCEIAKRWGATGTCAERSVEVVHAARGNPAVWEAPEVCVEAVGHQMDTLNDCLELIRPFGTVIAFGVPDHDVYAIAYETFFRKNASLVASVTPDWSVYLSRACELFNEFRSELEGLITHRMPIPEAERAFGMYESHGEQVVKIVLDASKWD
jgi:threonine dehydrogenase-like Zn-dependent dehydrogenase